MKPEYANTFGLRKVADPQGQILEVTLDISYKYMENALTVRVPFLCATSLSSPWGTRLSEPGGKAGAF